MEYILVCLYLFYMETKQDHDIYIRCEWFVPTNKICSFIFGYKRVIQLYNPPIVLPTGILSVNSNKLLLEQFQE